MIATRQDIRRAAGHLLICGFHGTSITAELREILREARPAGLVLFDRNVESPQQVAELCTELKTVRAADPLLLAVDQEGGRVARIGEPATSWPPLRDLGRTGEVTLAERMGAALGTELRAMNLDVDFAPVLDVDTNPQNPVIGDRALASDTECVARLGAALVRGLHAGGVAACGKHFPGHGDTELDSHQVLPRIAHDLERLRRVEWPPFVRAIEAGVGALMTAHVVVEALDDEVPATLSPAALLPLREELGFAGVIISDDLEMRAVADRFTPEQMAVRALGAGVDILLACHEPEVIFGIYRGIVVGAEREEITTDNLLAAESRVLAWRRRFYAPPQPHDAVRQQIGRAEHRELAQRIRELAAASA
jgi:beta-N-acetylhexosaminidase